MGAHIDYYIALNSPWVHLGSRRLEAMAELYRATVRIYPVNISDVFAGSGGLPLPQRSPQRQAYRLKELARWRDRLGAAIHIQPKFYPFNDEQAALCVIATRETVGDASALALAHGVLHALWQEEKNPGDETTLKLLIAKVGLNGDEIIRLAAEPRWAELRAAETTTALARGVFGAPSYVIGDEIFWGQDRLDFVERFLAGS